MTQSLPHEPPRSAEPKLRLGTRGSPLALWQAHAVRDALLKAHGWEEGAVAVEVIRTTGDAITDRALAQAGGKGLFTKELEEALLDGRIDLAVHSAKDMATRLPDGLVLGGYLPRADVRDALILPAGQVPHEGHPLASLKRGAKVGTASLRREAQLRRLRPDIEVALLRGNVQTRLNKVDAGEFDATLLALAGLTRLGLQARASAVLGTADFLPAVGQGAVAIETRERDDEVAALLAPALCGRTGLAVTVERAYLAELDGSCRTPIGGLAEVDGDELRFRGMVLKPDGSAYYEIVRQGSVAEAEALGHRWGREMKRMVPPGLFGG
ncbi:hydroxymethylbilane synthase [Ancylobacter sonchi]|uniref:hydroxymethylbilane synthase n=1 Tax=Ancylobacter sonchi TaxID=1937790 RepID=UPI001BD6CF78|nr:hydroxymethylbilane synthase [Ancylobacter sonchi]MBS7532807.1 hydroxymethylbilane synthase [Ancylobacter sonchi]